MMQTLMLLTHPTLFLIGKMLLVFGVLMAASQCKLSATNRAMIWRMGLLLVLTMPLLNQQLNLLNIAVSTDVVTTPTVVVPASQTASSQPWPNDTSMTQEPTGLLLLIGLIVTTISLGLLARVTVQLQRLIQLTQQATPVKDLAQLQLIKQTAQQLNLHTLPRVLHTSKMPSPATWGWFKPVILLPTTCIDSDDLSVVLLHEMAHIKRRDWVWMISAQFLTALFWFNPLLWLIKNKLINSFEAACDELVLQHQIKPSRYAETLLFFHNHNHPIYMATEMAQPSQMYQRLERILNPTHRSTLMKKNHQHLILAAGSLSLLLITSAQISLAHEQPSQPATAHQHDSAAALPSRPETPEPATIPVAPPAIPAALTPVHPTHVKLPTAPPLPTAAQYPTLHANELPLEMQLEHVEKMGIPLATLERRFEQAHQRIAHADQDIHPARPLLLEEQEKREAEERQHKKLQLAEAKQHELQRHRNQQKQLHTEKKQATDAQRGELKRQLQAFQQEIKAQQQELVRIKAQVKQQQLDNNQRQAEELMRLKQELAKTQVELEAAKKALKQNQ